MATPVWVDDLAFVVVAFVQPAPPPTSNRPKELGPYRAMCLAETYELMELVWSLSERMWAEGGQRPVCDECN